MTTARFAIPLLHAAQAQKELTVNEALQALEACVQPVVEGTEIDAPPPDPQVGRQYLVSETPEAIFALHAGELATFTDGGWIFTKPRDGISVLDRLSQLSSVYSDGSWRKGILHATEVRVAGDRVLSERQPAIDAAGGGDVVDQEARAAVSQILIALRAHGLIAT